MPPQGLDLAAATPLTRMHSGFLLLLWFAGVASVQFLAPVALACAIVACLFLALVCARSRVLRLLRRVRVLMLAILILFGWFTPGEAVLASWPQWSPSREGLMLAVLHGGRLLVVVSAVALLLERLPLERLVGGLYSLCRPFSLIGLQAGELALRLMLVLRFVDASPRGQGPMHWKDWLRDDDRSADASPIVLMRERLGATDAAVAFGMLVVVLSWSLS